MTSEDIIVESDVLVIGGGMAGLCAAIKASDKGATVTLVDKGYVTRSGQSLYAMDFGCFNPDWGHKLEEWRDELVKAGDHLSNRMWTDIVIKDSYHRYKDLESWGAVFHKQYNTDIPVSHHIGGAVTETILLQENDFMKAVRRYIERNKVARKNIKIMDRIMITDLLTCDGTVVGAVGIPAETYDFVVFKAKATVITTGSYGFKPYTYPGFELTADGEAIAYRAGAALTGKEFVPTVFKGESAARWHDFSHGLSELAWKYTDHPYPPLVNAEGDEIRLATPIGLREPVFEIHAGRGPLKFQLDDDGARIFKRLGFSVSEKNQLSVQGRGLSLAVNGAEGIWVEDETAVTSLPGLYAGGDSAGTRHLGGCDCSWGFAVMGAAVTGSRAGTGAAEFALDKDKLEMDGQQLEQIRRDTFTPAEREGGFHPRRVMTDLNHMLTPYYVLHVKRGDRLQATLTMTEFMREHLVSQIYAADPHELRLAHEAKNMILNAELKLRSSLFRTESRGRHYREDFPRRDDPDWLAWTKVEKLNGTPNLTKVPMPEEWWPDLSIPYEDRYPIRFPGE